MSKSGLAGNPNSVEFRGIPWNSVELRGIPWNSVEFRGTPWELRGEGKFAFNFKSFWQKLTLAEAM